MSTIHEGLVVTHNAQGVLARKQLNKPGKMAWQDEPGCNKEKSTYVVRYLPREGCWFVRAYHYLQRSPYILTHLNMTTK
jgi:hypothetical protein